LQSAARNNFSAAASLWNDGTLTEAQREAWRAYALAVGWINSLGESITLSGFAMMQRSNVSRMTAGIDVVSDGPTNNTLVAADETAAATITASTQKLSLAFDDTRDWLGEAGGAMTVFMGAPQNPGVNSFSGPCRYAGKVLGDDTTPPTTPVELDLPFVAVVGQKIWVQCRIIRADGRVSRTFRTMCTCA
jgi:hypothetical protein